MASEVRFDLKIELSDLNYPKIYVPIASKSHFHDLRGHLEAAMTSEVMKMVFRGNRHIDFRVIEVTELNFEIKSDL